MHLIATIMPIVKLNGAVDVYGLEFGALFVL